MIDSHHNELHPRELILASASPRRSDLLKRMGLQFKACPADVRELDSSDKGPMEMVAVNARLKAERLIPQFPCALILGSDTTVALGDRILNKPSDMKEAREMLKQLSGRTHTVYTAVALRWLQGSLHNDFVEASKVRFNHLDDAVIDAYFELVNPLDKAGAYGIQVGRDLIIESVEGSVENVMGLPIQALQTRLLQLGFDFRESR